MDKLGIEDFHYFENTFCSGGVKYSVKSLIEASKDIEPFKLPLAGIDISMEPWGKLSIKNFAYHSKRVNNCTLDHPIILDNTGYICDGWHRVVKAILNGDEYIMAKRLIVMPESMEKEGS